MKPDTTPLEAMVEPSRCRWSPTCLARRWRRAFTISVLLGLLSALVVWSFNFSKRNVATSVVLLRPVSIRAGDGSPPGPKPMSQEDLHTAVLSDEILGAVCGRLELPFRWSLDKSAAIVRLRGMVLFKAIPETALIKISVECAPATEAERICTALVEETAAFCREKSEQDGKEEIATATSAANTLENLVEDQRRELSMLLRSKPGEDHRIEKDRFNANQHTLEELKVRQIMLRMQHEVQGDPLIIRERPRPSPLAGPMLRVLRSFVLYSITGLGGGLLFGTVIAYGLETASREK